MDATWHSGPRGSAMRADVAPTRADAAPTRAHAT